VFAAAAYRLQEDGRVLLGLSAQPAGDYYQQEAVRFYLPAESKAKGKSKGKSSSFFTSSDTDEEWSELPRHGLA
jgi:hypothetical protein